MGLLDDCKKFFGSDNLYTVLSVPQTASENEIKKAYRRVSLLVHPDRVGPEEKALATQKFQTLGKVHCILSDKEKRTVYDETGEIDEESAISEDRNWFEYWRLLFPKITMKDITNFMGKYKGSVEEKEDLKKCYLNCEGDMNIMCEYIMGYEFSEEPRYREIIKELIDAKEIPDFPKFSKESAAKRRAREKRFKEEAIEAEAAQQDMQSSEDSLRMAITKRAKERFSDMISDLESKYVKKPRSSKKKKTK